MKKLTRSNLIKKILLPLMVGFSFVATATSTLAWFKNGVNIDFNGADADFDISAGAEASYYGGGTGAPDDPYIISNKLHLYNLAWLQYIGTYNKTNIRQLYFKVTADINMDGITLPPIGTDQYPFLGHFDGQGYEISNLTISNDDPLESSSAFGVMKPSNSSLVGTSPSDIIGFFGVVGKLPTQDFTYDSTIVSMANLTISNINVNSISDQTLIGLAAGYVNGNMQGIRVGGKSSLSVAGQRAVSSTITNNLSDYGLVGYAANKGAGGEYMQTLSKYYDSDEDTQGGGENWGGSLDMASLYTRLKYMQGKASVPANPGPTYVYNESYLNDTYENRVSTGTENIYRYSMNTGSNFAGSFNLTASQTNKVYLVGGHYVNQLYYSSYDETGYYITDGNGNYLSYSGSGLGNSTAETATVWHFTNTSGTAKIYTEYFDPELYTLTTYYLRNNNNSLNTTTNSNNGSNWTLTKNGNDLSIVNNSYHIVYGSDSWTLVANGLNILTGVDDPDYYVIRNTSGTTYYISNSVSNNGSAGRTTNISSAAHLTLTADNTVTTTSGDATYTLMLYRNSGARWRTASSGDYIPFVYNENNSTFTARYNNRTYYLRYSNSSFGVSTSQNTVSFLGCKEENLKLSNTLDSATIHKTGRHLDSNDGFMEFNSVDTTYFPINAYSSEQRDELGNVTAKQYEPTATNTGYVVGGTTKSTYAADNRSMVVSNYPMDRILYHSVDDSGNIEHVWTINGNGVQHLNETGLQKYNDYINEEGETVLGSKSKFQAVISGADNVGGLHFVNKDTSPKFAIGEHNVVDATNVKVNGATYDGDKTYQLPVYSIDFNLKKQGYINFFAGTYNGGYSTGTGTNTTKRAGTVDDDHINAFFSLYKVDRKSTDKTQIDKIREIKAIYSSGNSVNYTYSYKSYVANSATNQYTVVDESGNAFDDTGLTLLFDTDWIGYRNDGALQNNEAYNANDPTKGTLGAIFYFEIPVDSGEYCLGNVRNSLDTHDPEGAYLMYLDIGANGNEATDHYSGYCVTTYVDPVNFPTGVDFAIEGLTNAGLGGETLCVFVSENSTGTIYFSVNEEDAQGHVPVNDTIEIDDTSQISQYSYLSNNANDGFDITGNHLPADYEDPPDSGPIITRVSYLSIVTPSQDKYLVTVTDTLNGQGQVTSTVYHLAYTDEEGELVSRDYTLEQLQAALPAAEDYYINAVRGMITIVTLERASATSVSFNAELPELPWTNASNSYIITVNVPEGYSIRVTVTDSEKYTVYINSETPLVFTNNTVVYVEP